MAGDRDTFPSTHAPEPHESQRQELKRKGAGDPRLVSYSRFNVSLIRRLASPAAALTLLCTEAPRAFSFSPSARCAREPPMTNSFALMSGVSEPDAVARLKIS